jgi:hypothetical protein
MSKTRRTFELKTIAFGGVPAGNMNEYEQDNVAGKINSNGLACC